MGYDLSNSHSCVSVADFALQPNINPHPMVPGGLSVGNSPFDGAGQTIHGGQRPRKRVSF